jgi:opacity protein-like surface antigen
MKKFILATAVATAALVPQAFAQSKNFEGFSAGLSANFNNGKTEIPGQSPSESSTTAGIKGTYGWGFAGSNFILGASLAYDTGNVKMGTTSSGTSAVGKGLTTISIEPGFKASNDALVYAKLGYATVKGEVDTSSDNYSGTSFGIGVRSMLAKQWSLDLEAQQFNFTGKYSASVSGDIKPSATVISVGVNYHF